MKNKGLIITLIILLTIIVFALIMFLVIALSEGKNFKMGLISFGSKSKNIIYDNTFEIEEINNIEIKQDAGDIIFKESKDNNIQVVVYGENQNDTSVNVNNHNLNIDNTHSQKFTLISFGTTKNDIIIYIPSTYKNNIKIDNDYGICEIIDLEYASIDIDCDAGDVYLGKIRDATIKCDYGNIKIKEVLNKCNLKADCGNIDVNTISIREDSKIKADLGNVNINNTNNIYIEAEVDLGKKKINNNNRTSEITLKIDCDCGNIIINN